MRRAGRLFHLVQRADGETSERTVRPRGPYFRGPSWSLAACCELRRAYLDFRPDRLSALAICEASLDEGDGIGLAAFIRQMQDAAEGRP